MNLKCITFISCAAVLIAPSVAHASPDQKNPAPDLAQETILSAQKPTAQGRSLAGNYLSSLFAQRHHDWGRAGAYLKDVVQATPDEPGLVKRAMALAMGSGDFDTAFSLARKVVAKNGDNALARLFLSVESYHAGRYVEAAAYIQAMPGDSLSDFIMPLLVSWAHASVRVYEISDLGRNTIHIHHAALITDLLKEKPDQVQAMLDKATNRQDLAPEDIERIANLYAHYGENDRAVKLFEKILEKWPDDPPTIAKIQSLKSGTKTDPIVPVATAGNGAAAALYDMANLLFREYADDSARVFAQMALYLMPQMADGRLLLAAIDARNGRYHEAISSFKSIPKDNLYYLEAQRRAAELMEDTGDIIGAIDHLEMLAREHNDIQSLIRIGDIYRLKNDDKKAIQVYNRAEMRLGGKVPKSYWNLLYVRAMAYERIGEWPKAEADLKLALEYQPDHPYILNYLGYAWADQGINLDRAQELVNRAAELQPNDGYIIDSLGWVYFKLGRYSEALPHLEKAVQLLPDDPTINDHYGDVLWQIGRKREAKFQWKRAQNFSTDPDATARIESKLLNGLVLEAPKSAVAQTQTSMPDTPIDSSGPPAVTATP